MTVSPLSELLKATTLEFTIWHDPVAAYSFRANACWALHDERRRWHRVPGRGDGAGVGS